MADIMMLPPTVSSGSLAIGDRQFVWGQRTYVMGVLNATPDSFSDGGEFNRLSCAVEQAKQMVAAGVDIIDVGGQSTRPGAKPVSIAEEIKRVIPIIRLLHYELKVPLSIDTNRAEVAHAAINAGAHMINDVSGGAYDSQMLSTVARLGVPIILMHMRGTPQTMQSLTYYQDLVGEIHQFLSEQIERAIALGIPRQHLIIDPGLGFAKTTEQNIELLKHLPAFKSLAVPILIGSSRKSFIGHVLGHPNPKERLWGTAATISKAIAGGADLIRVHDVAQMVDVARMSDRLWRD